VYLKKAGTGLNCRGIQNSLIVTYPSLFYNERVFRGAENVLGKIFLLLFLIQNT